MHQRLTPILFFLVIIGIAVSLAIFVNLRNQWMWSKMPAAVEKKAPTVETQPVAENPSGQPLKVDSGAPSDLIPTPLPNEYRSADGVTSVAFPDSETFYNPFYFYGTSTAFENVLSWRVKQTDGKIVASGNTYVHSPDAGIPGPFSVTGLYDVVPKSASGTLEVYEASAKDGSPIHVVSIPVTLMLPAVGNQMDVYVYWANTKKDPNMLDCSKVFPVRHKVLDDEGDWRVAMHELLKGPTAWEKSQGYFSSLPESVEMPQTTASGGLDFNSDLEAGVGGSCRTATIRAQIEETWKRNSGAEKPPIISINGRTEDILQP